MTLRDRVSKLLERKPAGLELGDYLEGVAMAMDDEQVERILQTGPHFTDGQLVWCTDVNCVLCQRQRLASELKPYTDEEVARIIKGNNP